LTIAGSSEHGVKALGGSDFLLRDVDVVSCGGSGILARGVVGRCENVVVERCVQNGMYLDCGGRVWLEGARMRVSGNCREVLEDGGACLFNQGERRGREERENRNNLASHFFGLKVAAENSQLHLIYPLSLRSCTTENNGGGDWGGDGTISVVKNGDGEKDAAAALVVYTGREERKKEDS
jgi:hypothetical protein